MTREEFWKRYHRDDPDEAIAHPHQLRVFLANGKRYEIAFPGTALVTNHWLIVGSGPRKDGIPKSFEHCNWDQIIKIEEVRHAQRTSARKSN